MLGSFDLSLSWLLIVHAVLALCSPAELPTQQLLSQDREEQPMLQVAESFGGISVPFFASLERLSRLVDISYCIGSTGISKPFDCLSRCRDFPSLSLERTWHTGVLLSDSCGYIAVDHGEDEQQKSQGSTGLGGVLMDVFDGTGKGHRHLGDNKAIIVAFRGTYSITNTVVDLSTVPQEYVPYPSPDDGGEGPPKDPGHECKNCTVHMGFHSSWKSARKEVLADLKELKARHPDYPVHLVGHSLGGAVACLAALELRVSLGWEDVVVTTFGEPRVGNYHLARYVDKVFQLDGDRNLEDRTYRRVTHKSDPVPLLPLGEWGFRPHSGEVFITKEDLSPSEEDIKLCVGDTDPSCSASDDSSVQGTLHRLLHFKQLETSLWSMFRARTFPTRYKLWQLFFAHRDYFWRLGLCVPGGDPFDWGRRAFQSDTLEL